MFGISDQQAREKLLRKANLTLADTDDICRSHESTARQMKLMDEGAGSVSAVDPGHKKTMGSSGGGNMGTGGSGESRECRNCGRKHSFSKRELCPAFGKTCNKCKKPNHFAAKRRSKSSVRALEDDEAEEVYQATISAVGLADSQCVTVELDSGSYLRFQVDTGAQCNVVPLDLYKKATKDYKLSEVQPVRQTISAYGGSQLQVVGRTLLRVRRGDTTCRLDCKLVDQKGVRPLMGRKACLGMKIVQYLDNDQLRQTRPKCML